MKSKLLYIVPVLLCATLFLFGCGNSQDSNNNSSNKNENAAKTINFELNQTLKHEGLCEMSGLYAEVLDDAAKADGWVYYYTDTDKSPATNLNWKTSEGNYTTAEVLFTVKNTSNKAQTFADKITAKMNYQESKDSKTQSFEGTVFQQNPGQIDENGDAVWSTKPAEIKPGESTIISFRFDIPKDVYEKIASTATGKDTGIVETCEFGFDDKEIFTIDLTKVLILASKESTS